MYTGFTHFATAGEAVKVKITLTEPSTPNIIIRLGEGIATVNIHLGLTADQFAALLAVLVKASDEIRAQS